MKNERKPSKDVVVVRLDEALIARLSALMSLFSLPGRDGKMSDVLRAVIDEGLPTLEMKAADPGSDLRQRLGR